MALRPHFSSTAATANEQSGKKKNRSPLGFAGAAPTVAGGGFLLFLVLGKDNKVLLHTCVLHHCNFVLFPASHLALLVQHGQGGQILAWVESGLGVVLLGHRAIHVVPRVHEVVTNTIVVEVLTLKDQSQSPAFGGKVEDTD